MNINAKTFQKYAADPAAFRDDLLIDVSGVVRRLGEVMDQWQRDDFAALDPAVMLCNGRSNAPAKMRAYLERGRGHSKSSDIAISITWALAFANRPIHGYGFAADKDQAGLVLAAIATLIRLNVWLSKILEVQKNAVVNIAKGHPGYGSTLDIFASNVGSSYGILPDFIVADEVTHWPENADQLWHSIISSAAKRSNCVLWTISNAGFVDSWQWNVREAARTSDDWIFSRLDGPVASWFTPERLAEQQKMLPAVAFARLWGNQWSSGGGDALTEEDINHAFIPNLPEMTGTEKGWTFVAGVDLGLTRDCSAVVVLAVQWGKAGKIRLASHKLWRPIPGKKINLIEVEQHLVELHKQFKLRTIAYDPWQMEHLAQTLRHDLVHFDVRELPPLPANLRQIATLTIECFGDRRMQLYDCEPLRRDLKKLRVEEKQYGIRLTSPRDGEGHGDSFSAFAQALLIANELAGEIPITGGALDYNTPVDPLSAFERRKRDYQSEMERVANLPDTPMRDAYMRGEINIITPKPSAIETTNPRPFF